MDTIKPSKVPSLRLYTGAQVPGIALGTFGSDRYGAKEVADAVRAAAQMGYRSFDCAACYGNEAEIGKALDDIVKDIPREEIFVTSKLWNDMHGFDNAVEACQKSLEDLRLEYFDLYLIHWPFANYHPPGAPEDYHSPDARSYNHDLYMHTWRALEEMQDRGLIRHIGTSNMSVPKLEMLMRDVDIVPAVNQMEMHPTFQQQELFDFCVANEILPVGFCPLGSPGRPARDRTREDVDDLAHPIITAIAKRLGVSNADILIRWAVTRGQVPVVFSVKPEQLFANLKAASMPPLSQEDMEALDVVECGNRLIKGQVFLWKENQSWHDLWDECGVVVR